MGSLPLFHVAWQPCSSSPGSCCLDMLLPVLHRRTPREGSPFGGVFLLGMGPGQGGAGLRCCGCGLPLVPLHAACLYLVRRIVSEYCDQVRPTTVWDCETGLPGHRRTWWQLDLRHEFVFLRAPLTSWPRPTVGSRPSKLCQSPMSFAARQTSTQPATQPRGG